MSLTIKAPVWLDVLVSVEPADVLRGLENDDERILSFVCQLLALAESVELRERLLERLGVDLNEHVEGYDARDASYHSKVWNDEEFFPSQEEGED